MKVIILFVLILSLLNFTYSSKNEILLDEENNGKVFFVEKGNEVIIRFRANKTTGYDWRFHSELKNNDDAILSADNLRDDKYSLDYLQDPNPKKYAGVGGMSSFKFSAKNIGKQELSFVYQRPWETEHINQRTITIEVIAPMNDSL